MNFHTNIHNSSGGRTTVPSTSSGNHNNNNDTHKDTHKDILVNSLIDVSKSLVDRGKSIISPGTGPPANDDPTAYSNTYLNKSPPQNHSNESTPSNKSAGNNSKAKMNKHMRAGAAFNKRGSGGNGGGRSQSIALKRTSSISSENSSSSNLNSGYHGVGSEGDCYNNHQNDGDYDEEDDIDDISDLGEHLQDPLFDSRDNSPYFPPSLFKEKLDAFIETSRNVVTKYIQFIGPGIMVSVAYMDPGNYSTAVSAGALYKYRHLFVVLVSNLFAVFLQILCVKLGSVTGLDLAQNCRKHLPRWLCIVIYILAEIAIIATDLAEVVGTAIALNILLRIPLPVGVALTVVDVLLVLLAYRPNGPLNIVRYFEYLVSFLVFVVVICFGIELAEIDDISAREVLAGFFPSGQLTEEQGLYLSCGILGATVMPHSLYLGSGLVQPRLKDYDIKHGFYSPPIEEDADDHNETEQYKPTLSAIKYSMNYSIAELVISLFTVAIFVNSAILVVAGATLFGKPGAVDADLFSIYDMLKQFLGSAAATVFALALLFSGQSAGIVCTLAGQMVSEGFLHWSFQPWIRRLITRALAILPCFVVSVMVGKKGLADVLNASQVVLSLLLPIVTAPLLYFTASKAIMSVPVHAVGLDDEETLAIHSRTELHRSSDAVGNYCQLDAEPDAVVQKDLSNSKTTNIIAWSIFGLVTSLNTFLIISMILGAEVHL